MLVNIPDKKMTVEFPDEMDPKEVERQIYVHVYNQDVLSQGQDRSFMDKAKGFVVDKFSSDPGVGPITEKDRAAFEVDNPYNSAPQTEDIPSVQGERPLTQAGQDSLDMLDRAKAIKTDQAPDKNILSYAPYMAVKAVKGLMGPLLPPLKTLGMDSEEALNTAIEYWQKKVPDIGIPNAGIVFDENGDLDIQQIDDMPISEIVGATSEGVGFLGPASVALKGAGLVTEKLSTEGVGLLAKYARPFYRSILKGMIGGALLGEGKKDETLESMAMFGLFEGAGFAISEAPSLVKNIKGSTAYRKATIKERGLVIQDLEQTMKQNPGITEAELVKTSDQYFKQALEKRNSSEAVKAPAQEIVKKKKGLPSEKIAIQEDIPPLPRNKKGEQIPFSKKVEKNSAPIMSLSKDRHLIDSPGFYSKLNTIAKANNESHLYIPQEVKVLIDKKQNGQPLTKKQETLFSYVEEVASSLSGKNIDTTQKKETPYGYASADTFADIPVQAMEMPEIVKLSKELMKGRYPKIKQIIGRKLGVLGRFKPVGDGSIDIKADLFKDSKQASKTIAHEIGHLVDYLDDKTMGRGNILGRIASLKKYMKKSMESKPGNAGPLTDADRKRIRSEAKKMITEKSEQWIDEVIVKETPVKPQDIIDIWNTVEGSLNKDLTSFVKSLSDSQKKAIVKSALKGRVPEELKIFSTKQQIKTGQKIKVLKNKERFDLQKIYKELVETEIKKRQLLQWEDVQNELKTFTQNWKPFNPQHDQKYTKYRFSSPELYADALSALITNPEYLKQQAPVFYKSFLSFLDNKPMVKQTYDAILKEVHKTPLKKAETHLKDIYGMFDRSTKKRAQARIDGEAKETSTYDFLMTELWDRSHGALKVVRKMEKIPGIKNKNAVKARMAVQELQHTASVTGVYLSDFNNRVLKKLESAGHKIEELGAAAFYKRIAQGDRSQLANPLGIDSVTATKDLTIVGKEIWGAEKFKAIEKTLSEFRSLREKEIYPVLKKSALIKPDFMDYMEKNTHHVKWDVAAYFDKTLGKGSGKKIFQQIGTLNEIDNPIVATVLQDISLLRASLINIGKQEIIQTLKDAGETKRAKLKYSKDKKAWAPEPVEQGKGVLTVFEKTEPGKPHYYEVSDTISTMFDFDPIQAYQLAKIWRYLSQPLRELFVGKNPVWMANNLKRDFDAVVKNTPGARVRHIPTILKNYIEVAGEIKQEAFNKKMSPRIRDMKKRRGLPQHRVWSSKDQTFDNEIVRQLTELKLLPTADQKANRIPEIMKKAWDFAENTGYASELWGKVAAEKFLENNENFNPRERARITRELSGTPDAKQRSGRFMVLNNVFMFSEMNKAGIRQMATAYKMDKAGYAWKTFLLNVFPKVAKHLLFAGGGVMAIGLYQTITGNKKDENTKKIKELASCWRRIPEFDKSHNDCIPLGLTKTGKAAYLRIPKDYEGQTFGTLGYFLAKELVNQSLDLTNPDTFKDVYNLLEEQSPYSLHALINVIWDWMAYARGENPKDWKGYEIIPETVFKTGGSIYVKESLPYMGRYSWRSLGGKIFYDPGYGDIRQDEEAYRKLLKLPGLNVLGSFLRFSDRGLAEEIRQRVNLLREKKAEISLNANKAIVKLANGDVKTADEAIQILATPGVTKKKLYRAMARKYGSAYMTALSKATKAEKLIILGLMAEEY